MDTQPITTNTPVRQAAINGLAIVGFVALIVFGISLAVYATRFVPAVVNRIGSAAVYLGSVFNPAPPSTLSVVPTTTSASTTIFFNNANLIVATSTATSTPETIAVVTTPKTPTSPKATTGGTYQVQTSVPVAPHGLSDFSIQITAIGYLSSASTDSFVGAGTVPSGNRPAVKFTVKNIGTNWSGRWSFTASIPTRTSYTYTSDLQQSLAPGDSIDYILGFDQASVGSNQPVTITVNYDRAAVESDYGNNTATAPLNIQ